VPDQVRKEAVDHVGVEGNRRHGALW
jgi:hypothetical protein